MRWHCLVTRSVPLPDLVTTPVYLVTVELLPAPVEPTQITQLSPSPRGHVSPPAARGHVTPSLTRDL